MPDLIPRMPSDPLPGFRLSATVVAAIFLLVPARLACAAPKNLSSLLQPYVERGALAGAVALVANKERVLDIECVGYLSPAAVQQMTSKQTGKDLKEKYGFGWSAGETSFGHGGAYATNMTIDRHRGLILIWLVQHSGFPDDGAKSVDAFRDAAFELFGAQQSK